MAVGFAKIEAEPMYTERDLASFGVFFPASGVVKVNGSSPVGEISRSGHEVLMVDFFSFGRGGFDPIPAGHRSYRDLQLQTMRSSRL